MSSQNFGKKFGSFFSGPFFSHLLSPEDRELASIVYNLSLEIISSDLKVDSNDVSDGRIGVSRENLERIFTLFENASEARDKFVKKFKLWEDLRKENIKQLEDLIRLIQEDQKNCITAIIVGTTTALIGGAAATAALLFPPAAPALIPAAVSAFIPGALLPAATAVASFVLPVAAPSAVATGAMAGGLTAAGLGGLTAAGSTVTLVILREKRLEEARQVIKEDEMTFKMFMEEWFRHAQELNEATEELMGFVVIEECFKELAVVLSWCENQESLLPLKKDLFISKIKPCIRLLLPRLRKAKPGFGATFLASLLSFLFCLFRMFPSLLRLVSDMRALRDRLHSLDPHGLLASMALLTVDIIAMMCARQAAFGPFAGLGMCCHAATVVLSSLDLKNGGDGEPVKKVVEELQKELDILKEVFDSLASSIGKEVCTLEEVGRVTSTGAIPMGWK